MQSKNWKISFFFNERYVTLSLLCIYTFVSSQRNLPWNRALKSSLQHLVEAGIVNHLINSQIPGKYLASAGPPEDAGPGTGGRTLLSISLNLLDFRDRFPN